jgi:mannose-6-phosphate isomerase-like protein (cupin superfamily)
MEKISLAEKFNLFDEYWSPRIVGELNGQYIKLAKLKGKFVWHTHDEEDEYFQVIKGSITIHFREGSVILNEGESIIVPHGVEHMPVASEEAHVMLFEPKSTPHTGDVESDHTVRIEDQSWI